MANKFETKLSIRELRTLCDIEGYSFGDIYDELKKDQMNINGKWFFGTLSAIKRKLVVEI